MAFNFNLQQGFKNLISPFTNLLKKPSTPIFTPIPTPLINSRNVSPTIPSAPISSSLNFTPAQGMQPNTSTPQGPRFFAPPVLPQVKATLPSPSKPVFAPPAAIAPPPVAPVAPVMPVSAPLQPELPQAEAIPQPIPQPVPQPIPQPAPFMPTPAQQAAISSAEATYQKGRQISPEELSTQEDIDKIMADTERIQQSFRLGAQNISDQPIPLEFITGQLRSIENRALNQIQGLSSQAEPLERKLARLQATRTSSTEASKFALERVDKAVEFARGEARDIRAEQKDIRTEAESARRFGIEQADITQGRAIQRETLAETQRFHDLQSKLDDRKFQEDIRRFGITSALDSRKIAIDEVKAATAAAGKTNTTESLSNMSLVDSMLTEGNISAITGIPGITSFIPGTTAQKTKNQYNQLKSILSLDKRQLLKGSGQISDYESRVLDRASSDLGRNLSNDAFRSSLVQIRGAFANAAGLTAKIRFIEPNGQSTTVNASREEINNLLREGSRVEYVE